MTDSTVADAAARAAALETGYSCIVQAPAGSGKTGLLTQRYLALLAEVSEPEEVLAITFTRKAAAEMRQRVLEALRRADGDEPDDAHARQSWRLARAAVARGRALGWQLSANPNRLRIQTFDALNHALARQLPLTSGLGGVPAVATDPMPAYRLAARRTLALLDDRALGDDLARVLGHVDNRLGQLEALMCSMLARRDQWLSYAVDTPDAARLIDDLQHAVVDQLTTLLERCPGDWLARLCRVAADAAAHLRRERQTDHPLARHVAADTVPAASWQALPSWQALALLLLTARRQPRRSWDRRSGFPSPTERGLEATERERRRDAKATIQALAQDLHDDTELARLWSWVPVLPARLPDADQRAVLEALLRILMRAAMELDLVFAERGEMDFSEVQLRALRAVGEPDQPTDLALAIDHRLRHLLVDEFQDTSVSQFRLLQTLTAGWEPADGRTLFAVGDPMQSIYRFREAEVGLFLRAWHEGMGDIPLRQLRLSVNFRSTQGVVGWVNQHFPSVLAAQDDAARGAVSYTPAVAFNDSTDATAVTLHARLGLDSADEAQQVVALVQQALSETPTGRVAVLARARSHLAAIATALRDGGVAYQAVDIDPLGERPVVRDLRALTRALLHPADRLSWLTLLHSPWVGVPLKDLLAIAEPTRRTLPGRLREAALGEQVSGDSQQRIARLLAVIGRAADARGRQPLRQRVEGAWLSLGGLASGGTAAAADAAAFLGLLDEHAEANGLIDFGRLDEAIAALYAAPDRHADGRVQLMTMHKSKGLEFDTVILPGLGRPPRRDASELLYWLERTSKTGRNQLLMAPIRRAGETVEPLSDYVRALERDKAELESARLLYVAVTRAQRRLHLLGHIAPPNGSASGRPASGSLLERLWPTIGTTFVAEAGEVAALGSSNAPALAPLNRLAADWQPTEVAAPVTDGTGPATAAAETEIEFDWAGNTARHVGSIVHRYLERIANEGLAQWPSTRLDDLHDRLRLGLSHLGVVTAELPRATDKALTALRRTLNDDKGRWILDRHPQARCEWPLTVLDGDPQRYVIDRSFVDDQGVRWIIDYKTGDHLDRDIARFLDDEQLRYRAQLENYASIVRRLEDRPIRLALYFPLFADWRAWDYPN
jgi:ATP-dependent exoDNAse (exonuclease V) beta subunit